MTERPHASSPVVPCPTCQRPVEFVPASRWRPFCSERCRAIDLGAWAAESYAIPADAPRDDDLEGDGGTLRQG